MSTSRAWMTVPISTSSLSLAMVRKLLFTFLLTWSESLFVFHPHHPHILLPGALSNCVPKYLMQCVDF